MWWIIGIVAVLALIKWLNYKDSQAIRRNAAADYLRENQTNDELLVEDADDEEPEYDESDITWQATPEIIRARAVFITLVLICLDKRTEIDDRRNYGCFLAMGRFFTNDPDELDPTLDQIRDNIETINEQKAIQRAAEILNKEEKQYCYNVCADIYYYPGFSEDAAMLDYINGIAEIFGLDTAVQAVRQHSFELTRPFEFEWHSNKEHGFSIKKPAGWVFDYSMPALIKTMIKRSNLRTIDVFAENLNVVVEPIGSMSQEAYLQASKVNMAGAIKDFSILEEGPFLFKDGPGFSMSYTFEGENIGKVSNRVFILLKNRTAYVLTAAALDSTSAVYRELFSEMVDSFSLD